jgi:predicted TIM-barrel fold metal-dependent hydrolase
VRKNGSKIPYYGADMMGGPRDDIHAAASEAKPRVELLDQMGIHTQIVYPNVMGFAAPALVQNLDHELAYTIVAIYNDAMAEWQEESGRRLLPQAVLPFWSIEDSVKEAARIKELGLTGVTMAGEPHLGGLPDLGMPHWDPLYEALSDLELPIDIHIGASNFADPAKGNAAWPSLPQRAAKPVRSIQTELANSRFISNLCSSDLLLRWPKLNWVSVESGIGWIPYVLERVDYEYREDFEEMGPPELPPAKELFQKGIYGTFWFEDAGPLDLIPRIGADNILWETDFPHPTSLYPSPVERSEQKLKDLDPVVVRKIMQDNAAKLYKIPV